MQKTDLNTDCSCHSNASKFDWLLWGSGFLIAFCYLAHLTSFNTHTTFTDFSDAVFEFMNKMWWGLGLGIFFVGILNKVPRDFIRATLGDGNTLNGLARATLAGLCFDLCNHGILLIAMKLYERGASMGQVMAFLIASPWNSFSLTIILISLIGLKVTIAFIALSAVIALLSGVIFQSLVKNKKLPPNPNAIKAEPNFKFFSEVKTQLKNVKWHPSIMLDILRDGLKESNALLKWIFLGVLLAAFIRVALPIQYFQDFFGPSVIGLSMTLLAATLIEVCSEGSVPIASDLFTRAQAPGNAFTFLMAGASTDYTEIMLLKETTKSWKIALFLPLITVPQILFLGYIINLIGM